MKNWAIGAVGKRCAWWSWTLSIGLSTTLGCRSGDSLPGQREERAAAHSLPVPREEDDVVLRMRGDVLRVADAQAEINRLPEPLRSSFTSPAERRAFMKKWLNNQILIREAQRRGYDREPGGARATIQAMTLRVLKERIETELTLDGIGEADIEEYYRKHPEEFSRLAEARVTQIVVKERARASEVLSRAALLRDSRGESSLEGATAELAAFRKLVFEYTEDEASKALGGDVSITRDDSGKPRGTVSEAVAQAAFLLEEPGELSPVVEAEGRYHILKLRKRLSAHKTSLAEARPRIERRLAELNRERRVDELAAELAKELHIEVFPDRLLRLNFEPPPAAGASRAQQPNAG